MSEPLVSLCLPTNGVSEWVFPVLDSIYNQKVDCSLFEVVITDNGSNTDFKDKIRAYVSNHENLVYAETSALPFLNEIESYKRASGILIKFVNHRTKLVSGALQRLIDFVKENQDNKPIIYYSNGMIGLNNVIYKGSSFNEFVKNLSYWSSWSTGMTIWKSDFDKLPEKVEDFNELFPHTTVLFNERHRNSYIIDDSVIMDEIPQGKKPKGNYDLYYAFGVEYPRIIEELLKDNDITEDTFEFVKDKNLEFIASLYWQYNIKNDYCSYDLSGFNNMLNKYYKKHDLNRKVMKYVMKRFKSKMSGKG